VKYELIKNELIFLGMSWKVIINDLEMNCELTINELQVNHERMMSKLYSHEWKFIWMNSIHHTIVFNVGICDSPNLKMLLYLTTLGFKSKLILLEYYITI